MSGELWKKAHAYRKKADGDTIWLAPDEYETFLAEVPSILRFVRRDLSDQGIQHFMIGMGSDYVFRVKPEVIYG